MGYEVLKPYYEDLSILLNDTNTIKIVSTVNKYGEPHAVAKHSLHILDNKILFLEIIESSSTNKNMVHSIWFDKIVSILIIGQNKQSFQIKVKIEKALISGKRFQKYYKQIRDELGDIDLSTVWILNPISITNQTLQTKINQESSNRPYFLHLDRLSISEDKNA